jgi:bifunctional UDP-N-acetylglucosamine pyrophosphorylase/glucosamine-1-phosphate N-acetyltransferase
MPAFQGTGIAMPLSVIILAAGQGKRMHSDRPKVLQPLAGRPLLAHVLEAARALSPDTIHIVYGHGGDEVRAAFPDSDLTWALQAQQLGTGHAVAQAMPAIPDDHQVLVLYGDVPLISSSTLKDLIARGSEQGFALLSVLLADATGYGRVLRDNAGNVYRIVEEKDANRKEKTVREANTGVLVTTADRLRQWLSGLGNDNAQGEYYLTDVITLAVRDGLRVQAVPAPSIPEVLGVNDRLQLAELEAAYRHQCAKQLMLDGVTLADPARLDVRGSVTTGRDVRIDINVILEGRVVLGDRVIVGAGAVLRDVEIAADTVIHPYSVIEGAQIDAACVVGPYARIRPGSHLHAGAHVGNFVELKNTALGFGSKANHLTYLGDSQIGAAVNVGAGTITCNYDGKNKWPTTIEDGAFIGSGSMLVAPVTIGSGATIGAGSVITKSAPRNSLTLERGRQQSYAGWSRPDKASPELRVQAIARSQLDENSSTLPATGAEPTRE